MRFRRLYGYAEITFPMPRNRITTQPRNRIKFRLSESRVKLA